MSGNTKDFKVKSGIQPTVYHEAVGTVVSGSVGYSLANASYDSKSFSVASQTTLPVGLRFKSDGTKVYVLSTSASDAVYQYSLSTAWDVSTASYDSVSLSVATQTTSPIGMYFKADGTSVYVASLSPTTIYQYDLTTAWDLSTASYASKSYNASTQMGTEMRDVLFKPDGASMYLTSSNNDAVYQYTLSTAWDVSTASYDSKSFNLASFDSTPQSTDFNSDGTKFYMNGQQYDHVRQFSLTTAYDISTATDDAITFDFSSQETGSVVGISFGDSGNKLYIVGITNDTIYQYSTVLTTNTLDLSTGSVFELTPTSDIQVTLTNPAASGTSSGATLLLNGAGTTGYDIGNAIDPSVSFSTASDPSAGIAFSTDGTKMYLGQLDLDSVVEYSLSTAFDITTASLSHTFSVLSQDTFIGGIAFKPDGTSLYITGRSADNVYQYTLSTAWDLSTASYASKTLYVGSQGGQPYGLAFNADGTRVSVQNDTRTIYEYTLSTAWDISTGSYASASFDFTSQSAAARSFAWNSDGTKMFLNSYADDTVYQYSLSTAYRPSTASYDSVSYAYGALVTSNGIAFGDNGTKMYLNNTSSSGSVHQYSTATPATITYDTSLQWPGGTAPTSPAIGDTDIIAFSTSDGGTSYKGVLAIDGAK